MEFKRITTDARQMGGVPYLREALFFAAEAVRERTLPLAAGQ
jgi:hypothetical protein